MLSDKKIQKFCIWPTIKYSIKVLFKSSWAKKKILSISFLQFLPFFCCQCIFEVLQKRTDLVHNMNNRTDHTYKYKLEKLTIKVSFHLYQLHFLLYIKCQHWFQVLKSKINKQDKYHGGHTRPFWFYLWNAQDKGLVQFGALL